MRICVFGAGAIGGHLAAKLAAAGHDISVVARGANVAAIRAKGIALREGARGWCPGADARGAQRHHRPARGAQGVIFKAMSIFLDKIKVAEADRQRIVAERKRLVAEADAALAAHDREETAERARVEGAGMWRSGPAALEGAAKPPSSENRTWIGLFAVLASCLAIGVALYKQEPVREPRQEIKQREPKTGTVGAFELKLDRDLDSFAQRLKESERQ